MMSMANQLKDDNSGRQTLFSNEILPPWQLIPLPLNLPSKYIAVSYTHLDVYKRKVHGCPHLNCEAH